MLDAIHEMSAVALGLPARFFEPFYTRDYPADCGELCGGIVVAKYYPPPVAGSGGSPLRYAAHTDYTGWTILKPDDVDASPGANGLQVLLKSGAWHSVTPRDDGFIVNSGTMYEDWTNGRWMSTVHRVVPPEPGSTAAATARLSIPFFAGPHSEALIDTLPTCLSDEKPPRLGEPITAGAHLERSLKMTQA